MSRLFLGILLMLSWSVFGEDQGFRFEDGKCLNSQSREGLNPAYFGQCGDLRQIRLGYLSVGSIDFRGSRFDNSTFIDVDFAGSDLSDTTFASAIIQ